MDITPTEVHRLIGSVTAAVSLILLAHEGFRFLSRWVVYLLPAGLILLGSETFLDPLIHGGGESPHSPLETQQHYLAGGALVTAGIVEVLRVRGILASVRWQLLMPALIATIGILFFLHSQHGAASMAVLVGVQHRVMAATLLTAAFSKFFGYLRPEKSSDFDVGWLIALLIFGLEMLLYTEGGASPVPSHH